jgi:hypothetical protein
MAMAMFATVFLHPWRRPATLLERTPELSSRLAVSTTVESQLVSQCILDA